MRARRFARLIRPHPMFGLSVGDERTLLWYCLGLIAEGGGGDVVVQQKTPGNRLRCFRRGRLTFAKV